jgi:hypothetical protein
MDNANVRDLRRPDCLYSKKRGLYSAKKAALAVAGPPRRRINLLLLNAKFARAIWGVIPRIALHSLKRFTETYGLSIAAGDLQFLDCRWYVTHSGVLRIAKRSRCAGIRTAVEKDLSDPTAGRWVFKAAVYKTPRSKGFVGYGDANPSNVSPLVRGAEMRVAETRAVNRALRKAYGIGLCSVEELGWVSEPTDSARDDRGHSAATKKSVFNDGQPRLRDRLCLLIRQHQLDPTMVKRYAADFCRTEVLRDASREQVESFINHLAECATKDREGLLCKLNGYAQPQEVKP